MKMLRLGLLIFGFPDVFGRLPSFPKIFLCNIEVCKIIFLYLDFFIIWPDQGFLKDIYLIFDLVFGFRGDEKRC